ncbi:uncharacterized protein PHACADRAFT_211478 [Phanerochaete carnosa HHB-10118-sp]|uniref:DUF7514 domain-containing protein n=1 Tax=Phanerochaete carnosa (strain HHB-10118-sp) TaxID=650164 RepID=K5UV35_PHACS|nr:uncharacterized protein PHACADRAFT_211478 [Phanerochaete carnosa HHB-10118-sp]EKM53841.1 hypothetical protein PHACADRAFT_211478 [Phanerochaete carnosa HHB-10118-sp]
MKYSYSPSAGFSSTPVHTRAISLNVAPPTSQYASPTAQSPSPLSPPSSSSSSFYGNFAGSQSQPTPPPSYAPQLPPRSPEHDRKTSTGYIPVSYDSYGGGVTPEQFYGSLIDTSGRPTAIFSRVADAFFFWLDQSCDIHGLRGTGMIEPAKYGWMMGKLGSTPEAPYMLSFYTTTGIPFRYIQTPQGQVPVVDRRGWLHMVVFEAKATPQESYQHWAKSLTLQSARNSRDYLPSKASL